MTGLRVALVCDWFLPRMGGIELHLRDLAQQLTARGHDVRVITPTPGADVVDGIRVVRVPAWRAPRFGFVYTPGAIAAIGDAILRERVDVAHCHVSIISPTAIGGAFQAQRREIPTLLTFHSVVSPAPAYVRAIGLILGCPRWPAMFSAVSELVARRVAPITGGAPIEILRNAIDSESWRVTHADRAAARQPDTGTIEIVSAMRLNLKKQPLALVALMQALTRLDLGSRRVRLRIAGDGPLRSRMAAAIERAGLRSHVQLLGHLSRGALRTLFASADLFVLPTERESFGLAAAEARCAGLPVVAMARSGVAELIEHERDGLLARSGDDFAAQVARLVIDDDLRARITEHNRCVSPNVDWSTAVLAHERLYQRARSAAER